MIEGDQKQGGSRRLSLALSSQELALLKKLSSKNLLLAAVEHVQAEQQEEEEAPAPLPAFAPAPRASDSSEQRRSRQQQVMPAPTRLPAPGSQTGYTPPGHQSFAQRERVLQRRASGGGRVSASNPPRELWREPSFDAPPPLTPETPAGPPAQLQREPTFDESLYLGDLPATSVPQLSRDPSFTAPPRQESGRSLVRRDSMPRGGAPAPGRLSRNSSASSDIRARAAAVRL